MYPRAVVCLPSFLVILIGQNYNFVYYHHMSNAIQNAMRTGIVLAVLAPSAGLATPQFARTYRVDCAVCHSSPPRLNATGLRFIADGYRLDGRERFRTFPLAVWNTVDGERRHSADLAKAFPSRVELISAGPVGRTRAAYFAEWRALSQSLGGNGRLLNRSGRFEDLFVRVPTGGGVAVTAGQFRALMQVDVSLRLSLSEPLVFSSSVPGSARALGTRLTALRAFSASGRQPAVRVEYQRARGASSADGWFAAATLPLAGELTIPMTDAASFELEARPKGVFLETFRRSGLTSVGGHGFVGDNNRRFATAVVAHDVGRMALVAGLGAFHAVGVTDTRVTAGGELTIVAGAVAGARLDHRTGQGRDPALLLYGNGHLPFGPERFRQALRLQLEHRVQPRNHATAIAVSHVF